MARRTDLDRAKGLAILFVVFGHIVARQDPASVHWYEPLRRAIYAFHMPFFFYLSGMVAWISGGARHDLRTWPFMLGKRARRLLLPFLLLGVLIVAGKLCAARIMHVDNVPADFFQGLSDLVWHTAESPALSIWYLFVLFVLSIVAPIVVALDRGRPGLMLLIAAGVYVLVVPSYIYANRLAHYAIFFALGLTAAAYDNQWLAGIDRWRTWLLMVFVAGFAAIALFGGNWPQNMTLLILGTLSMGALHSLVRSAMLSSDQVFLLLGRYSLMIYLFNTIFIGLAKGLLMFALSWNGLNFLLFTVVLMSAGTLGPVLLKRHALRLIPVLDRLTD